MEAWTRRVQGHTRSQRHWRKPPGAHPQLVPHLERRINAQHLGLGGCVQDERELAEGEHGPGAGERRPPQSANTRCAARAGAREGRAALILRLSDAPPLVVLRYAHLLVHGVVVEVKHADHAALLDGLMQQRHYSDRGHELGDALRPVVVANGGP